MVLLSSQYGIVFDKYYTDTNYSSGCKANPDIAGVGVVVSFVSAAILTTVASIAAAILDAAVRDDKAFLPEKIQIWLHKDLLDIQIEHRKRWRRTLDRLILGFADQQLVTGFALLTCGYFFAFPGIDSDFFSAHWNLIVYLSCLSSTTHLACVLTLRKYFEDHKATGILRLVLIISFSFMLIASIIMSWCFRVFLIPLSLLLDHEINQGRSVGVVQALWYGFQASILVYLFYAAIMQLLPRRQEKLKNWVTKTLWPGIRHWLGLAYLSKIFRALFGHRFHGWIKKAGAATFWYFVFLTPGTVFVVQIGFSLVSLVFSLLQKFMQPSAADIVFASAFDTKLCSLNSRAENAWGFGQLLAMIFLALPVLSAWETYVEERHKQQESQLRRINNITYFPINSDQSAIPLTPMSSQRGLLNPPSASHSSPEPSRYWSTPSPEFF